jgi:uncharacterized protein YdgA (DUF945 family)
MRRLILSALVLGAIAVAAVVPYLFGVEAERIFERQMALLDSSRGIGVESRFKRGWFSSTAETAVSLRDYDATVVAEHVIEHGPFPISAPGKYLLALRPLQALIDSTLSIPGAGDAGTDLDIGALYTVIDIDSATRTRIELPAADTRLRDAALLRWRRIQGQVDFDPSRSSWEGSIESDALDWTGRDATLGLGKWQLTFLTFPGKSGLTLGKSTLNADHLSAKMPGSDHVLRSTGLVIDSSASEQGQSAEVRISGSFGSAQLPEFALSEAKWHLSATNLDLDTLTELNRLSVDSAIPLNKLLTLVSRRSATLDSGLSLQTDAGPLAATARLRLAGAADPSNPLALIGALEGDVRLDMPAAVAEFAALAAVKRELSGLPPSGGEPSPSAFEDADLLENAAAARIQSWIDADALTRDGDRYRFEASIRDGSLSLNGKPFNVLSLLR